MLLLNLELLTKGAISEVNEVELIYQSIKSKLQLIFRLENRQSKIQNRELKPKRLRLYFQILVCILIIYNTLVKKDYNRIKTYETDQLLYF